MRSRSGKDKILATLSKAKCILHTSVQQQLQTHEAFWHHTPDALQHKLAALSSDPDWLPL